MDTGPVSYFYTFDEVNEKMLAATYSIINYNLINFVESDAIIYSLICFYIIITIYFLMENTLRQSFKRTMK